MSRRLVLFLGPALACACAVAEPSASSQSALNACESLDYLIDTGYGRFWGTTSGGGNSLRGSCGGATGEERLVGFIAPMNGTYRIDTQGSVADTVLYVRDTDCAGPELACNDNADDVSTHSSVRVTLQAGQAIAIIVDSRSASGSFNVNIVGEDTEAELAYDCIDNDHDGLLDCDDPDTSGGIGVCDPAHNCEAFSLSLSSPHTALGRDTFFQLTRKVSGVVDRDGVESIAYFTDYGDGTKMNGYPQPHRYAAPGAYVVRVNARTHNVNKDIKVGAIVDPNLKTTFVPSLASFYEDWEENEFAVWESSMQLYNPSSFPANVSIVYVNQNNLSGGDRYGTYAAVTTHQIPAGRTQRLTTTEETQARHGRNFRGSAIVTSDVPVVVSTHLILTQEFSYDQTTYGPPAMSQYNSVAQGQLTSYVPMVLRNEGGFDTQIDVMNVGTSPGQVTLSYTPLPGTTGQAFQQTFQIGAGATQFIPQKYMRVLGERFNGSAIVRSTVPVAVEVHQIKSLWSEDVTARQVSLATYAGLSAPSSSLSFPVVMANNNGYGSNLRLYNPSTQSSSVSITYGPNLVGGYAPPVRTFSMAPGEVKYLIQGWGPEVYAGPATVRSTQPLVGFARISHAVNKDLLAAYEGFAPNQMSTSQAAPLVVSQMGDVRVTEVQEYNTVMYCQNGGSQATDLWALFSPNTEPGFQPSNVLQTVAGGAAMMIKAVSPAWGRYNGAAQIVSLGTAPVGCVVTLTPIGTPRRDKFMASGTVSIPLGGSLPLPGG